jgi:hypothetical protein
VVPKDHFLATIVCQLYCIRAIADLSPSHVEGFDLLQVDT